MKIDSRFIDPIVNMQEEGLNSEIFNVRWNEEERKKLSAIYTDCLDLLTRFRPLNEKMINKLFPMWKNVIANWEVVFSVGHGHEQEFFITSSDGKRIILLDLIRVKFSLKKGYDLEILVLEKLTRQLVIDCIAATLPYPTSYKSQLSYLTCQYGLAYLLSYSDFIEEYQFEPLVKQHYKSSKTRFIQALNETDKIEQFENLQDGISGHYWQRFAMVTGKLYFAQHLDEIESILYEGVEQVVNRIVTEN